MATRTALLNATIDSLCTFGYAAATTVDIAPRAGVSRGAQQHHFPTKAALLAAAVEHLLERRLREFTDAIAAAAARPDRLEAALDVLWEMFQGPAFVVWVELWIAARTNPELAATITKVELHFTEESRRLAVALFPSSMVNGSPAAEMMRDFAFAVMTGVALQRLVPRGQRPASDYLQILKQVARVMLGEGRPQ